MIYNFTSKTLASPKSATLYTLFSPTNTFLAAKSLWMKFCVSRYAIPDATCAPMSICWGTLIVAPLSSEVKH